MEIRGSLQTEFVETPSVKEAVLFSNTATFLLDRLRKDTAASYVAHMLDTTANVNLLEQYCKRPPTNPLDLLWVYVLFAALSLKDDLHQFKERIGSIDLSQIQWGDEIRKAVIEDKAATSFLNIRFPEVPKSSRVNTATNVTSGTLLVSSAKR